MRIVESQFNDIYQTNYAKVNRLYLGYTNGDVMQAKDLTQEVFIKVWENRASFRKEAQVSTWIYRITVNTCLIYLRKNKSKQKTSGRIDNLKVTSEPFISNDEDLKLKQLYNCINGLNKENKAIILLELEECHKKTFHIL